QAVLDALALISASDRIRPEAPALEQDRNQPVVVHGALAPVVAGAVVAIEFKTNDGARVVDYVKTSRDGSFATKINNPGVGEWKVRAFFAGDDKRGSAEGLCGRVLTK
ncbi:MAG: hypothetical protein AAGJ87_09480, partial [Pseudomonadota bacterium]